MDENTEQHDGTPPATLEDRLAHVESQLAAAETTIDKLKSVVVRFLASGGEIYSGAIADRHALTDTAE